MTDHLTLKLSVSIYCYERALTMTGNFENSGKAVSTTSILPYISCQRQEFSQKIQKLFFSRLPYLGILRWIVQIVLFWSCPISVREKPSKTPWSPTNERTLFYFHLIFKDNLKLCEIHSASSYIVKAPIPL